MLPELVDPTGEKVVIAIVRNDEGRFLLILRKNQENGLSWIFPGGKKEPRESDAETAQREVLEETGVECAAIQTIGERIHPISGKLIAYVLCEYRNGQAHVTEPDIIAEVSWMRADDVLSHLRSGIYEPVANILRNPTNAAHSFRHPSHRHFF